MNDVTPIPSAPAKLDLSREDYFADMVGELAGALEDVIGLVDASSFIAMVGNRLGDDMAKRYADEGFFLETAEDIARICVDMKNQVSGSFRLETFSEEGMSFTNCDCPFGDRVKGRPSLCMMMTNVFGRVAANATGYARVHVTESIAAGHDRCRVTLGLKPVDGADGHEFFS
ncbi:methanogen output domain 1-containing protein [Pseudosulfitobacter sp. DSM 107133]|uniref:methanogen output domain 1-containing protein n=1 Tax=Pseudosulfitobacter sp. DSM 107133 TaxID=2883100 RepID=UPI000DF4B179|nr:methanogen output domain 1-containing protein [Pseudosulfitobacter sp. DSM 107133]UOA26481.1 hypothetical protein DSM107133_01181 [Pseudosulfitobacter sp. DSM 107133]